MLCSPSHENYHDQACLRWLQLTASSQRLLEMQSPFAGALREDRFASTLRRSVTTWLFIFCKTNLCNESPMTSFSLKKLSLFSNVCIVSLNGKHWTTRWDRPNAITKRKNGATIGGHRNYKTWKTFRGSDDVICSKLERRWLKLSSVDPRLNPRSQSFNWTCTDRRQPRIGTNPRLIRNSIEMSRWIGELWSVPGQVCYHNLHVITEAKQKPAKTKLDAIVAKVFWERDRLHLRCRVLTEIRRGRKIIDDHFFLFLKCLRG